MSKETTKKTFEDKIRELEATIKELENGQVDLDDAINKYTIAMNLAKECSEELNSASEKVNKILLDNGELKDFEIEQ